MSVVKTGTEWRYQIRADKNTLYCVEVLDPDGERRPTPVGEFYWEADEYRVSVTHRQWLGLSPRVTKTERLNHSERFRTFELAQEWCAQRLAFLVREEAASLQAEQKLQDLGQREWSGMITEEEMQRLVRSALGHRA